MRHEEARQMVVTRDVAAPPARVFRAWTSPAALDAWWGPDGFVTTTSSMTFEVGGAWVYEMAHPTWGTFPNRQRYLEIVPAERLVYLHDGGEDTTAHHVVVTFAPIPKGTRITMTSTFATDEALQAARAMNAEELGQQTLQHLEAWVADNG